MGRAKRLASLCALASLAVALLSGFSPPANAQPEEVKVYVGGRQVQFDVPPVLESGHTLVPLRAALEALGATVEWDAATQTAVVTGHHTIVALTVGRKTVLVDGREARLAIPARLVRGRVLVPLRFVSETLGHAVDWDEAAGAVGIASHQAAAAGGEPVPAGSATPGEKTAPPGKTPGSNVAGATRPIRVPVLMYHEVGGTSATPDELHATPRGFEAQLDLLVKNGFTALTLDQLRSILAGRAEPPPRPIVLTFDDGYMSAYTTAFPLLRARGLVGAFFIPSALVGSANRVSWFQLREMRSAGMEIEAHSATHSDLVLVSGMAGRLAAEIGGAREALNKQLGAPVEYFSYPGGRHNQAVLDAVKAAGFVGAFGTESGWASSTQDPYKWRRMRVNRTDTLAVFETMIGLRPPAPAGRGPAASEGPAPVPVVDIGSGPRPVPGPGRAPGTGAGGGAITGP